MAFPPLLVVADDAEGGIALGELPREVERAIGAALDDDDDFVGMRARREELPQRSDAGDEAVCFVESGDDERKERLAAGW